MKNKVKYLVIGAVVVLGFIFLIQRSCHVSDRLSVLKGQHQAYKETARQEKQKLEAEVAQKEGEIQGYKERIGRLELERAEGQRAIDAGNREIEALEKLRAGQTDKDEIIATQDKLIFTLKYELNLEREDKAKVIEQRDLWKAAYEKEHEISLSLKAQLDREEKLRQVSEALNAQYEKRIQGIQFKSNIKTVLIAGLAAYGGYRLIKGGGNAAT